MVKFSLILIVTLIGGLTFAQNEIITPHFFVVRQGLSIDANKSQDVGIHVAAEYFFEPKLSLIGEGNIFLASAKPNNQELLFSHAIFSGGNYHFINKNTDFYIGFQPGLNISERIASNTTQNPNPILSPLASLSTGFSYYSANYFHFYTQIRYMYGNHLEESSVSLTGFKFTFGLGYNLSQIFKKKN